MTTIAYDGRSLAGDTQTSLFNDRYVKVRTLSDGRLYGACGELQDMIAVRQWLEFSGDKPKVEDGFACIVIAAGECLHYENKLVAMPVAHPHFAVGSGRDFAMAAMQLGKSAAEAITVAHALDIHTGAEVVEIAVQRDYHVNVTVTGLAYELS